MYYLANFGYQELSGKRLNELSKRPDIFQNIVDAIVKTNQKIDDTFKEQTRYKKPLVELEMRQINDEVLPDNDLTRLKLLRERKNKYMKKNYVQRSKYISQKKFREKLLDARYRDLESKRSIKNKSVKLKNPLKVGVLGLGILGATAYGVKKLRDSRSDKGKQRGKYNV